MLLLQGLLFLLSCYALGCCVAYWLQETLIFHPTVLTKDYTFRFETDYEELYLEVAPNVHLHALRFRAENSKGIVFYVHGNAGSLQDWGSLSSLYISLGYDLFMFDYRGFGKSDGKIKSQEQFFDDVQILYDYVKEEWDEKQIIVEGFSIGTATAAKIAVENNPRHLILKAPYYSLVHLIKSRHPYLPTLLLKYQFMTIDFLKQVTCPTTVFHGTADELIPVSNAERLSKEISSVDFIVIPDCLHNDIPYSSLYQDKMQRILV
jgi:alpha-beta hydrolase superfamily lysophospholipase